MTPERNTLQKTLVYETVNEMHNHPTAQEIYERLHHMHPSVSRATVYRILGTLANQGKILKIALPDGADHFDFNVRPHDHLFCRECKRIGDVFCPTPKIPIPPETDDYLIEGYFLLYHGICGACRNSDAEHRQSTSQQNN